MSSSFKNYSFTTDVAEKDILGEIKKRYGDEAMLVTKKQIQGRTSTKNPVFEVLITIKEEDYQKFLKKKKVAENLLDDDYSITSDGLDKVELSAEVKNKYIQYAKNNKTNDTYKTPSTYQKQKTYNMDNFISIDKQTNYEKVNNKINSIKNTISNKYIEGIDAKTIYDMQKDIKQLTDKISTLASMQWEEKAVLRNNLAIPPEFAHIYKKAKQSGMIEEHLEAIMMATLKQMPSSMRANQSTIERYFNEFLRRMLPCRVDENIKEQKVMMLVGPTGVGKTTTLAKLAYRYAKVKKLRTGIITLDTYRLGAVEQLRQYAGMMGIPMHDVLEAGDFDRALRGLSTCDVILVDTIGSSQYDYKKLEKIYNLTNATNANLDINLVLNAGHKYEDLLETYKAFSFLNLDTMIITKFDETKLFGNVFSLICETNKPVSFFSVGQEVPNDLMEADSKFLVDCILDGFYKVKG